MTLVQVGKMHISAESGDRDFTYIDGPFDIQGWGDFINKTNMALS